MYVGRQVNLALTGLALSKHIVKRVIPHRRGSEVCSLCCLLLPCSVRRYKYGNHCKRYATIIIIRLHRTWFRGTAV